MKALAALASRAVADIEQVLDLSVATLMMG